MRESVTTGKHKTLLVTVVIAALVAVALTIAVARLTESQSTTGFDYTLPVNPYVLDDAQLTQVLDKAKGAGVESMFAGAVWWYMSAGQPTTRSYDWSGLDRLVEEAEARGMTVRLQLSGTPDWVHPDLKNTVPNHYDRVMHPPRGTTELGHWSNFVDDVVSRYKGRVDHYEIWNEPNTDSFWKPSPNPAEYAALLRAGYLSAKNAYPDATVAFGGLSRNDVGYLDAYYSEAKNYSEASGKNYFFDIMDVHPYSSIPSSSAGGLEEPISPDRNAPSAVFTGAYGTVDANFLGIKKIKSTMEAQGDSGKSIFVGEYGFSTTDSWMKAVPDYGRALYLKRAYALARDLPYVTGLSWYAYHPNPGDGSGWTILREDLSETMSFRALRQVTGAEPGGATVSLDTPNNCSVSGTYRVSPTTNLGTPSNWELYVAGAPRRIYYDDAPIDWDTTKDVDGKRALMVAAYPRQGGQAGSVWPSNVVSVTVNNAGVSSNGDVTVSSLCTDASSYTVGGTVKVTASVYADAATTVDQLNITTRPRGTKDSSLFESFYDVAPYTIETSPKTVTAQRAISKPGTYVLWVSYLKDGSWHRLRPEEEFTVR